MDISIVDGIIPCGSLTHIAIEYGPVEIASFFPCKMVDLSIVM